ncbi:MAG: hypothetical protein KDC38_00085 [Planctomycetes bacterium]|nr:hypothetical protein [Planctomycetota bacterium]
MARRYASARNALHSSSLLSLWATLLLFVLSSGSARAAMEILVLETGGPGVTEMALTNYGYPVEITFTGPDFNVRLDDGTEWDLVIIDDPTTTFDTIPLQMYIDAGGRAIVNYGAIASDPALQMTLGISSTDQLLAPADLFAWDLTPPTMDFHPVWDLLVPLSVLPDTGTAGADVGTRFTVAVGANGVGGFTPTPMPSEAGIVIANGDRTVAIGHDFDTIDALTAEPFVQNTATWLLRGGCVPIDIFECSADCNTGTVLLEWRIFNGGAPPSGIEILFNGSPLPGAPPPCQPPMSGSCAMSFSHQPGPGVHQYAIRCLCPFGYSEDECRVVVERRSLIWRAELSGGITDSSAAVASALDALGESYEVVDTLDGAACPIQSNERIFALLGTFPDNHVLTSIEAQVLEAHVLAGGSVYIEGSNTWGFDPLTVFSQVDGVDDLALDGDDSCLALSGADFGSAQFSGFDATYVQDQIGDDSTDRLTPATTDALGSNSAVVWQAIDPALGVPLYATGIYHDTPVGFGKVLSQSWEFGGYDGDRVALMGAILGALDVTPVFSRGDANDDGALDIADAIYLLNHLFVGGPGPHCESSADANDDDALDLGDVVTLLTAIFSGGAPLAPPYPNCGPDPTVGALDCGISAGCP